MQSGTMRDGFDELKHERHTVRYCTSSIFVKHSFRRIGQGTGTYGT
jgi:hypothetical protein